METKWATGFVDQRRGSRWPHPDYICGRREQTLGRHRQMANKPKVMRLNDWLQRHAWMPCLTWIILLAGHWL